MSSYLTGWNIPNSVGGFHLKKKDIDYINEKGLDTIREHARDLSQSGKTPGSYSK